MEPMKSRMEDSEGRSDPRTAHKAAGDIDLAKFIPDSCLLCFTASHSWKDKIWSASLARAHGKATQVKDHRGK